MEYVDAILLVSVKFLLISALLFIAAIAQWRAWFWFRNTFCDVLTILKWLQAKRLDERWKKESEAGDES